MWRFYDKRIYVAIIIILAAAALCAVLLFMRQPSDESAIAEQPVTSAVVPAVSAEPQPALSSVSNGDSSGQEASVESEYEIADIDDLEPVDPSTHRRVSPFENISDEELAVAGISG